MPAMPGPGGSRELPDSGTPRGNACWGPCLAGKGDTISASGLRDSHPPGSKRVPTSLALVRISRRGPWGGGRVMGSGTSDF